MLLSFRLPSSRWSSSQLFVRIHSPLCSRPPVPVPNPSQSYFTNRTQTNARAPTESESTTPAPAPVRSIYISTSTNPYFNLSLEDWLFRHAPSHRPLLLLYRDDPCVVVGRNQNPWKEVNFRALDALNRNRNQGEGMGIPFIRRRSGGGTVYHDLGNTNFSIHLPRASFDKHKTAQIVLRAVRSLGIPGAYVNERNDICVEGEKVSGSAYKIVNKRAYHHGTMLISTRLDTLGEVLRPGKDKETMETKGVASVRSPVRNLQYYHPAVTHQGFVDAVVREFREEYGIGIGENGGEDEDELQIVNEEGGYRYRDVDYIRTGMAELPSWEWAYGQTPEFTYSVRKEFDWGMVSAKIRSKHGVILDCDCSVESLNPNLNPNVNLEEGGDLQLHLHKISDLFKGRRYGFAFSSADPETETQARAGLDAEAASKGNAELDVDISGTDMHVAQSRMNAMVSYGISPAPGPMNDIVRWLDEEVMR
ncbi:hypothetical protein GYMLUDRAFT_39668 [Collybiopsis luxurians FD-317 M1]|nr:hypothetical protein GYMLUDRAFT_39668 [Collybiopsis luxurians FD-317 M1]